ncbi:transposase, partial [Nocardia araoensis]|uniref:transposase n=1 Tax=Nocardia araoensis TaxID=228600 RepID=UPI003570F296
MLAETIRAVHSASRGCYGVRRIHAELTIGMGIEVGSGQVHLIMKRIGLQRLGLQETLYQQTGPGHALGSGEPELHRRAGEPAVVHRH